MQFRKTSFLTKLLILAVGVYAFFTLVSLQDRVSAANERVRVLEEQVLYAEQEYALAEQDLAELGSDKSIMKIARTRLGMVELGEIVLCDADAQ